VKARATNFCLLDYRNVQPRKRAMERSSVPAGATSNDDDIELFGQPDTSSPIVADPQLRIFRLISIEMYRA